jgi:hypothetical protein
LLEQYWGRLEQIRLAELHPFVPGASALSSKAGAERNRSSSTQAADTLPFRQHPLTLESVYPP